MRGSLTAVRLLTLLLFLLLIAICSYWALQILAPRPAIAPSASIGDAAAAPNLEPATVLFGSANAPTAAAASGAGNIQVSGVAEAGPEGVVILSIDGKPGAAFGVNSTVTEGTVVKSVGLDKVVLEQRGKLIELKTPTRASLDILSSGVGKARAPSDGSTAAPVSTRTLAPPPPPPPPPQPSQPQFQPPQPPQQQQMQQQQLQQQQEQLQQQQLQQQQLQQQQMQQQAVAARRRRGRHVPGRRRRSAVRRGAGLFHCRLGAAAGPRSGADAGTAIAVGAADDTEAAAHPGAVAAGAAAPPASGAGQARPCRKQLSCRIASGSNRTIVRRRVKRRG
jgi:hypothetical protein